MEQALQDKLVEYLNSIEKGVVDVAPKAYQMAVEVNYLAAIVNLIGGVIIIAVLCTVIGWLLSFPAKAHKKDPDYFDSEDYIFHFMTAGFVGFFTLIGGIATLCNSAMWITLINKDLGLVYTIWQKFVG